MKLDILLTLSLSIVAVVATEQPTQPENGQVRRIRQIPMPTTTTTARPKKRPSNIFSLFNVLFQETRQDASRALNEIGTLFNSQFAETTRRPTSTTPIPNPSDNEVDSDDVTTTTEPYRISRGELQGIIRRNVGGLIRLFGAEFRTAIRDSTTNVRDFGRGFRDAVRPFLTPEQSTKATTTKAPS